MICPSDKKFGGASGTNWLQYASTIDGLFKTSTGNGDTNLGLPNTVDLGDLPNCKSAKDFFSHYTGTAGDTNAIEFRFKFSPNNTIVCQHMFHRARYVREVEFVGGIKLGGVCYNMFNECERLVSVIGEIEATSCSNLGNPSIGAQYAFAYCNALENVEFKPNTISVNVGFAQSSLLTQTSIISILNGLNESVTGKTLILHADVKDKMTNDIFGTVDTSQGYNLFVPSEQGTVSLMDFATNPVADGGKGWTVA